MQRIRSAIALCVAFFIGLTRGFLPRSSVALESGRRAQSLSRIKTVAVQGKDVAEESSTALPKGTLDDDIEETTRKYGLEGGLFKSAQQGNFDQTKSLIKKYGAAYLVTSISLAIVSFAACFALVDAGVDVGALLDKVGIYVDTGSAAETAGTATIAYVAHKAASPLRTVPVIALTPVVAQFMGKQETPTEGAAK